MVEEDGGEGVGGVGTAHSSEQVPPTSPPSTRLHMASHVWTTLSPDTEMLELGMQSHRRAMEGHLPPPPQPPQPLEPSPDIADRVLYELLVHSPEWHPDSGLQDGTAEDPDATPALITFREWEQKVEGRAGPVWKRALMAARFAFKRLSPSEIGFACGIPLALEQSVEASSEWHVALAPDASTLALFEEHGIAFRRVADRFRENCGTWQSPPDAYPRWRQMAWSCDSRLLAVALSSGSVYVITTSGHLEHTISARDLGAERGVAELVFREGYCRPLGVKCPQLLVLTYAGQLHAIFLPLSSDTPILSSARSSPPSDPDTLHDDKELPSSLDLHHLYSSLTSLSYNTSSNLLAIAGSSRAIGRKGSHELLTVWRVSDTHPYFVCVHDGVSNAAERVGSSWLPAWLWWGRKHETDTGLLSRVEFSPSGKRLATLDVQGTLTIYQACDMAVEHAWGARARHGTAERGSETGTVSTTRDADIVNMRWWDDEALILISRCGEVTLTRVDDFRNLLGDAPEVFQWGPSVTIARKGRFFVLECERLLTTVRRIPYLCSEDETAQVEEDGRWRSWIQLSRDWVWRPLWNAFTVEKMESKTEVVMQRTFRLVEFCRTTPEQLLKSKVETGDYEAALFLAQSYGLDTDAIYQRQWETAEVSSTTISAFLDKIHNVHWVLSQCVQQIADTIDPCRLLLQYGLEKTGSALRDLWSIDALAESTDQEENTEDTVSFPPNRPLSQTARDLCRYRLLFLNYLDRLCSFVSIVGEEEFCANAFASFRVCNLVEAAVMLARHGEVSALKVLFTYHGETVLPARLRILSQIPETMVPGEYAELLPAQDDTNKCEAIWPQKRWRDDVDWVEESGLRAQLLLSPADVPRNEEDIDYPATTCELTQWYVSRAKEIDRFAGQVENAHALVEQGVTKGVPGLESIQHELEELEILVYDCGINIGLDKYTEMSARERFALLLRGCTVNDVVERIRQHALPFLARNAAYKEPVEDLLHDYLLHMARDQFPLCCRVIVASRPTLPEEERVIADRVELLRTSLDCVYACQAIDALDDMNDVFESLPAREEEEETDLEYKELQDRVDVFESHLAAGEIMEKYDCGQPLSFFLTCQQHPQEVYDLVSDLCRQVARHCQTATATAMRTLLGDLLSLREKVFGFLDEEFFYVEYCKCLLACRHFRLARETLGHIAAPKAEELVLSVAREYFNSAASHGHPAMQDAKECLAIISTPEGNRELKLIAALHTLSKECGMTLLPLQVRLADKLALIEDVLRKNDWIYRNAAKVTQLGDQLGLESPEDQCCVLEKIAWAALRVGDYHRANEICRELIQQGFKEAWRVCLELGDNPSFSDLAVRLELVSFVLAHCPDDVAVTVVCALRRLESRRLCQELGVRAWREKESKRLPPSSKELAKTLPPQSPKEETEIARVCIEELAILRDLYGERDWERATFVLGSSHPFYTSTSTESHLLDDPINKETEGVTRRGLSLSRRSSGQSFGGNMEGERRRNNMGVLWLCAQHHIEIDDDTFIELAHDALSEDTALFMAYMLHVQQPLVVSETFSKILSYCATDLSKFERVAQMACRVLAFRAVLPDIRCRELLGMDVHELSALVDSTKRHQVARFFAFYDHAVEARRLRNLVPHLNVKAFLLEETSRQRTLLEMVRSNDSHALEVSLSLSTRYNVARWDILASHVVWLLSNGATEFEARVRDVEAELLERPEDFLQRLNEEVFPHLQGTQHTLLAFYYGLVADCKRAAVVDNEEMAMLEEHQRSLQEVARTAPHLDYKMLIQGKRSERLRVIAAGVNEANVHILSEIASRVPKTDEAELLTPSTVYLTLITRLMAEKRSTYQQCSQYLEKLTSRDLYNFAQGVNMDVTFSTSLRTSVLQDAVQLLEQRQGDECSHLVLMLQRSLGHLRLLQWIEREPTLLDSSFSHDVEQADGDVDAVTTALMSLCCSSTSPHIVARAAMAACDALAPLPETTLLELAKGGISEIYEHVTKRLLGIVEHEPWSVDTVSSVRWPPSSGQEASSLLMVEMESLAREVSDCLPVIWQILRGYALNPETSRVPRAAILEIMERHPPAVWDEAASSLVEYHRTWTIVHDIWGDEIPPGTLACPDTRDELFSRLLETADTKRMFALSAILREWEKAVHRTGKEDTGVSFFHQAWHALFLRATRAGDGWVALGMRAGEVSAATFTLDESEEEDVCSALRESQSQVAAVKFALLSPRSQVAEAVVQEVLDLLEGEEHTNKELMALVLARGWISRALHAPKTFASLVQAVVEGAFPGCTRVLLGLTPGEKDVDASHVPAWSLPCAVAILCCSHHYALAGHILLEKRGFHPCLRSTDTALVILRRYLEGVCNVSRETWSTARTGSISLRGRIAQWIQWYDVWDRCQDALQLVRKEAFGESPS